MSGGRKVKIGIVGSRRRNTIQDYMLVKKALLKEINLIAYWRHHYLVLVSGGCRKGADSFVDRLLVDLHIANDPSIHYAEWQKYGDKAGFVRNTAIAQESDILIACPADDRKGGTEDTIKKFQKFHPDGKLILV